MERSRNRRRKVIIDKKFQFGLSLKVIVCLACYLVLFCLMAVFSPFLVLVSGTASEEAMVSASSEIVVFVEHLLLPLGLTFACLALHTILLSHRIAGPVYRFNRTFEAMGNGDLSIDVRLRDGDYLRDLEASYNEMIAGLRGDLAVVKKDAADLVGMVRESGEAGLVERGEALLEHLSKFRVSPDEKLLQSEPDREVQVLEEAEPAEERVEA